jgi:large subunit ribosomal protein L18
VFEVAIEVDRAARRARRHRRVRKRVTGTATRPRLCVYKSLHHLYAQIVDDEAGRTLAAAATVEPALRGQLTSTKDTRAAELVGKLVAERALAKGIQAVVFDRGGYPYHGRVRALADAARKAGIRF